MIMTAVQNRLLRFIRGRLGTNIQIIVPSRPAEAWKRLASFAFATSSTTC